MATDELATKITYLTRERLKELHDENEELFYNLEILFTVAYGLGGVDYLYGINRERADKDSAALESRQHKGSVASRLERYYRRSRIGSEV